MIRGGQKSSHVSMKSFSVMLNIKVHSHMSMNFPAPLPHTFIIIHQAMMKICNIWKESELSQSKKTVNMLCGICLITSITLIDLLTCMTTLADTLRKNIKSSINWITKNLKHDDILQLVIL
jgi:hypothetical protein